MQSTTVRKNAVETRGTSAHQLGVRREFKPEVRHVKLPYGVAATVNAARGSVGEDTRRTIRTLYNLTVKYLRVRISLNEYGAV